MSAAMMPGTNCADAPITIAGKDGWLLNTLGDGFVLLVFGPGGAARPVACGGVKARVLTVGEDIRDEKGVLTARYDGRPGTVYLIRPDQYVAGRWRSFDEARIARALARAICA